MIVNKLNTVKALLNCSELFFNNNSKTREMKFQRRKFSFQNLFKNKMIFPKASLKSNKNSSKFYSNSYKNAI